jgi:hypothetical protein
MAWTAPKTWVGGEVPSATSLNAHLRDNLLETMPAKATTEGDIFVGAGPNAITTRRIEGHRISTFESTTSTSYVNLATTGPTVTVTHGAFVLVMWSTQLQSSVGSNASFMSYAVSGSNTIAASDNISITQTVASLTQPWRVGNMNIHTTLTPGTSTFTAKYRVESGTADYSDRFLAVIPF